MEKIDTVVIDKTGTLTEGKPKVTAVWTRGDFGEDELLRLAASLERASEHPLASATVEAAKERTLELSEPSGIEAPAGKGVHGTIEGHKLTIGNANFLESTVSRRPSSPSKRMNCAPKAPRSFFDHRGGRHGALLGQRDQQRTAVANCCDRLAHDPRK
jgi:cation transport ATPase